MEEESMKFPWNSLTKQPPGIGSFTPEESDRDTVSLQYGNHLSWVRLLTCREFRGWKKDELPFFTSFTSDSSLWAFCSHFVIHANKAYPVTAEGLQVAPVLLLPWISPPSFNSCRPSALSKR